MGSPIKYPASSIKHPVSASFTNIAARPESIGGTPANRMVHRESNQLIIGPYLMTGYDRKTLTLAHSSPGQVDIRVDVDIDGNGNWRPYRTFAVPAGQTITHRFPDAFCAYWARTTVSKDTRATAQFLYE